MSARVAWIQKQLARWEAVTNAIDICRNFHRLRPDLQNQAISILQDWQVSERILSGAEHTQIQLRIISAFSLPKSMFRVPSTWVKVVSSLHKELPGFHRFLDVHYQEHH